MRTALAAALAAALLVPATPAPRAAAAPRANLTVRSLAGPARIDAGGTASVSVIVSNTGGATAAASTLAVYVSRDGKAGSSPVFLPPAPAARRLGRGRSTTLRARLTVPFGLRAGRLRWLACADARRAVRESRESDNCRLGARVSVRVRAGSAQLIAAAVAAGRLTAERGLLYRAYAVAGDRRLPAAYRGVDGPLADDNVMREAIGAWASLSPATRSALAPLFVPPMYRRQLAASPLAAAAGDERPGAGLCTRGLAPDPGWSFFSAANGKVRIWYQPSHPGMQIVAAGDAARITADIWPKLTRLMGAPLGDGGATIPCRGGSDAVDVVVQDDEGSEGHTTPFDSCWASPAWVRVNADNRREWHNAILTHELMHVMQYRYPYHGTCDSYSDTYEWLDEAVAQWAIDYVYPKNQFEAFDYTTAVPARPIDRNGFVVTGDGITTNVHAGYIFFFDLARHGRAAAVPATYRRLATLTPLPALDAALPGGLHAWYPRFAADYWNRGPVTNFLSWDRLVEGVGGSQSGRWPFLTPSTSPPQPLTLGAAEKRDVRWSGSIPYTSAAYQHYSFPQQRARSITFTSPFAAGSGGVVQALYKLAGGRWRGPEDWTAGRTFCRTTAGQDLREVVLIASNPRIGSWTSDRRMLSLANGRLSLAASCTGLPKTLSGTLTVSAHAWGTLDDRGHVYDTRRNATIPVTYALAREGSDTASYRAASGSYAWTESGTSTATAQDGQGDTTCRYSGGGTARIDVGGSTGSTLEYQRVAGLHPKGWYTIGLRAMPGEVSTTVSCDDGISYPIELQPVEFMLTEARTSPSLAALSGSSTVRTTGDHSTETTVTWRLTGR